MRLTFQHIKWCLLMQCAAIATAEYEKLLLADVTTNKLTREHDGTFGMWSYHGTAKESHASQTEFIYNADLLTEDGHHHPSIASTVYPNMGVTSDMDPVYQEYLILQCKVTKIDGVILEWGYKGHPTDQALQSLLPLVKKHFPFKIGVNWCDHWLEVAMKNRSSAEFVAAFHESAQYLFDGLFSLGPDLTVYSGSSPVVFLFGGGVTSQQFKDVLSKPFNFPGRMTSPVWLGSYLNFVSGDLWSEWKDLINGTFGWVPSRVRPVPGDMKQWDYYGTLQDAVTYQANVSKFGEDCMQREKCVLWSGSVSPGFDNRGCAGWGGTLKYLPRKDLKHHVKSLYDAQWKYISQTKTNMVVIATLNDFPEATTILGVNGSNEILESTELWASQWKGLPSNPKGLKLPELWYRSMKTAQFYNKTRNIHVSEILQLLDNVSLLISHGNYSLAENLLNGVIRSKMDAIKQKLHVTNITVEVPSVDMYPVWGSEVNRSYFINSTGGLYLQMNESLAAKLRKENFKGILLFQYQLLKSSNLSSLKVYSSSQRTQQGAAFSILPKFKEWIAASEEFSVKVGDYAEVCSIVVKCAESWHSARVELYKDNQSWDHTSYHGADLSFKTSERDTTFLVSNVSLSFQIYSPK